ATVAVLYGFELGTPVSYGFALTAAICGAFVFAVARPRHSEVPQEAIIGIVYAVASGAAILVIDRAPHGAEQVKSLLVGSILWVTWEKVAATAALYALIGLAHLIWKQAFWRLSNTHHTAKLNLRDVGTDFAFYGLFALVVTSSVQIAGVLLVFCFLIVPAVASAMMTGNLRSRLVFGWLFGAVVSILGCVISYAMNLPTGATIVCLFGGTLLFLAATRRVVAVLR
ncbi:MAG: metal ABC transporter permease, partial [Candidatus Poribacteria bacterium]|nr:metal ABC transporter permease [Candidatus Poribacteria bacterium]